MRTKGVGPNNLGCSPLKLDKKKPNFKKAATFDNYENATSTFPNFNSATDTVFSAISIDPGAAEINVDRQSQISGSKGASNTNPLAQNTFGVKTDSGQKAYVALKRYSKK